MASRIPDVGNPWLDAGIVSYSTMGYNRDRKYWEKWFPADFITESFPGQFRNWFYAILAMSTMMEQRAPMKVLLGHGLVRDQWDRPMHKSAGNAIPFEGAADEGYELTDPKGRTEHFPPMSADLIRWLFCRSNPANNIDFGPGPAEELRAKFTLKLWNTYAFFCNYARLDGFDPEAQPVPIGKRPDIDRWILSDLQLLVEKARTEFERFNLMAFCQAADERDRRAVERFADQICEELNLKKVSLHDPAKGPLLRFDVKPNMKTLGPKFGPRLKAVQTALAAMDPAAVAAKVQAGESVE